MAYGVFDDLSQLNNLYQQSMSPVGNYGQGLLAIAMQKRQERMRAQELEAQRQMNLERTQIQEQAENARAAAANKAVFDRWKSEHDTMAADKREDDRRTAVEKANALGAKLPAATSFDVAAQTYVDLRGKSYIEANRRMGTALSGVLRNSGTDPKAFATKLANMVADDPGVAKALSTKEREDIRNNPDKIAQYRKQFANSSTKKYDAFVNAIKDATSTVTTDFEKEAASKPELQRGAYDLKTAAETIKSIQKDFAFSPQVESDAFEAYSNAAKPPAQPAPTRARLPLPGSPAPGVMSPTGQVASPAGSPFMPETATPGGMLTQGVSDIGRTIVNKGPDFINSLIYPSTNATPAAVPPPPAPPTDPSVLARLRLQKFLQESSGTNNTLFPTAFPAYNTNQFTAPLSPSP